MKYACKRIMYWTNACITIRLTYTLTATVSISTRILGMCTHAVHSSVLVWGFVLPIFMWGDSEYHQRQWRIYTSAVPDTKQYGLWFYHLWEAHVVMYWCRHASFVWDTTYACRKKEWFNYVRNAPLPVPWETAQILCYGPCGNKKYDTLSAISPHPSQFTLYHNQVIELVSILSISAPLWFQRQRKAADV